MIYTVTMNPSLDNVMICKAVNVGQLNRSSRELHLYGGKGINISIVLKNLGISSTCLGFVAGYIGDNLEMSLKEMGCYTDFIKLDQGCTRINVKLIEVNGRTTEINGNGPEIHKTSLQQLIEKINLLEPEDILVLSGNVPNNVSRQIYGSMAELLAKKGCKFVVDAECELLLPTLKYRPVLIKPNINELEHILHTKIVEEADLIAGMHSLAKMGARNVLVSRGKDGAVLLDEDGAVTFFEAPKGTVLNAVGSGDSMVAAFVSKYQDKDSAIEASCYGVAAGSAGAFSELLPEKEAIEALVKEVKIIKKK